MLSPADWAGCKTWKEAKQIAELSGAYDGEEQG